MAITAQHDPMLKLQLKERLESFLYTPVWEDQEKRLRRLVLHNSRILNSPYEVFSYQGETYINGNPSKLPRPMLRLSPQLKDEMDAYLHDVKEVHDMEKPYVMGYITQVLNLTCNREDHLSLFPESVHKPILEMRAYSPYGATKLAPHVISEFIEHNEPSLVLMKKRQMLNLLMR